jgi:hypothetical protein
MSAANTQNAPRCRGVFLPVRLPDLTGKANQPIPLVYKSNKNQ